MFRSLNSGCVAPFQEIMLNPEKL